MSEQQLLELSSYRESRAFDAVERAVLEYATVMSETPTAVSDELFAELRSHFDPAQLLELTAAIAWENYRARFNHALGIASDGFSEGAVCALPAR